MSDLWLAIAVIMGVALGIGAFVAMIAPKSRDGQLLCLAISLGAAFAFLSHAAGQLYWAEIVPDSAAIVWSNLTPLFVAVAAGVCCRLNNTPRWRRLLMSLSLFGVSLATAMWPFINLAVRPQPNGGDFWEGPVAMQTSWATCSPAAAATFLTAAGMPANEVDMIPRCLTDASGTPTLGLYRGVKLIADEHDKELVINDLSLERLLQGEVNFPVLLMVKLPLTGVDDPRYAEQWGWIPGVGHSVVALRNTQDGQLVIADPAQGLQSWSAQEMRVLWHGESIRIEQQPM